jgi:hypothetical protein
VTYVDNSETKRSLLTAATFQYLIRPQIANVESNRARVPHFSFGEYFGNYSSHAPSHIKILFHVTDEIAKPLNLTQVFHFHYGVDGQDEVYFERPLSLGIKAKMHVRGILGKPQIAVNRSYYRFIRSRINNFYPPGVHLADTLFIRLLENRYLPLHCAAISCSGEGTLLLGPPGIGKSLTAFLAVKRGFGFLSEDIAIIDRESVYSDPYTDTFYYHNGRLKYSKSLKFAYDSFIHSRLPLLSYLIDLPSSRINEIVQAVKIDEKVPIKNIFLLDRGEELVTELDPAEALRRALLINRNKFSYHKNTLLFAYSYFNPSLNLGRLMALEEEVIRTMVNKVKCYLVRASDPRRYIDLIERRMK